MRILSNVRNLQEVDNSIVMCEWWTFESSHCTLQLQSICSIVMCEWWTFESSHCTLQLQSICTQNFKMILTEGRRRGSACTGWMLCVFIRQHYDVDQFERIGITGGSKRWAMSREMWQLSRINVDIMTDITWWRLDVINPFNASWSKLLLLEGFSAILV